MNLQLHNLTYTTVRYYTPNVYTAVIAWYYVAPGMAVFLAGQLLISTGRIWFARLGVGMGRRARLPRWPLSPTSDGPAIVIGEVHHPVKPVESPTPDWPWSSRRRSGRAGIPTEDRSIDSQEETDPEADVLSS